MAMIDRRGDDVPSEPKPLTDHHERTEHRLTAKSLRKLHPLLYRMMFNQLLVHTGLGTAGLFTDHPSPIWYYIHRTVGFGTLGVVHLVATVLLVAGLWRKSSYVLASLLLSVALYWLTFALVFAGVVRSWVNPDMVHTAWETPFFILGIALMTMAAYWECYRTLYRPRVS